MARTFALTLAAVLLAAPAAFAQTSTDAPAPAAGDTAAAAQEATEVDRLRADFRARFVDYDERLEALGRRIDALEKQLEAAGATSSATVPADDSSTTMTPADAATTQN